MQKIHQKFQFWKQLALCSVFCIFTLGERPAMASPLIATVSNADQIEVTFQSSLRDSENGRSLEKDLRQFEFWRKLSFIDAHLQQGLRPYAFFAYNPDVQDPRTQSNTVAGTAFCQNLSTCADEVSAKLTNATGQPVVVELDTSGVIDPQGSLFAVFYLAPHGQEASTTRSFQRSFQQLKDSEFGYSSLLGYSPSSSLFTIYGHPPVAQSFENGAWKATVFRRLQRGNEIPCQDLVQEKDPLFLAPEIAQATCL